MKTKFFLSPTLLLAILPLFLLPLLTVTAAPPGSRYLAPDDERQTIGSSPFPLFIENAGQWDTAARFQTRNGGSVIWLAQDSLWLTLLSGPALVENSERAAGGEQASIAYRPSDAVGVHVRLSFVGANPVPRLEPFGRLDTRVSYLIGNDPAGWRPDVPVWSGVRYVDLYPGLNLEMAAEGWQLVCRANCEAALQSVRLRVEGAADLRLEADRLRLDAAAGDLALPLLQVVTADGRPLAAATPSLIVQGNEIIHPFLSATQRPRHMSPVPVNDSGLHYSTYLGGSDTDRNNMVAVDQEGATYVAGLTYSADFPTVPGAFDISYGGAGDGYVTKFDPDGGGLIYSAYLGGAGHDNVLEFMVDREGNAYLGGTTESTDFPATAGAFDTTHNGGYDTFVAKLNDGGNALIYATYLGGSGHDYLEGLAVNDAGEVYAEAETWSSNLPTTAGSFDQTYNGQGDVAVSRLNAAGNALVYSTFVGGANYDCWDCAMAIDGEGAAYITGYTKSGDYPVTSGAYDVTYNGGWDGYVTKISESGSGLVYSTFLGGSADDCYEDCDVIVGADGSAYIVGNTYSAGFPTTPGAYDTTLDGGRDAFVTRLSSAGDSLIYSTFLGGSSSDQAHDAAVGLAGNLYVVGKTSSTDFPTTVNAYDASHNGQTDVFVVKLDAAGSELRYSTYLGGSGNECGYDCGLVVGPGKIVSIGGLTDSTNFPTTSDAYDPTYNGGSDGFLTQLTETTPSGCTENCLRSAEIRMRGRHQGGLKGVQAAVTVLDENGEPVPNAAVYVNWLVEGVEEQPIIPDQADLTNYAGIAHFFAVAGIGTYTITVDTITKPDYTFDPENSVLTATISIP
ncbi:MAG: SBBP repeat-containing protein [Chloroflexota bacterium]